MKALIEVSAEMTVHVRFKMEVDASLTLTETEKQARSAAERVASETVGSRGDSVSAQMQRVTSFSTKLLGNV
jgi:hypothetical protein